MAAVTINTNDARKAFRFLVDKTITNQAVTAATKGAVKVPGWATSATFYLWVDAMTGTTPLIDFIVQVPDFSTEAKFAAPDDNGLAGIAGWDGITQLTGASSPLLVQVDIGPHIDSDDTGSATASCRYGVTANLPPWLVYTYTLDGTTGDEDYTFRIGVQFRP